jgi:predicted MFS family arabinose efflux permease
VRALIAGYRSVIAPARGPVIGWGLAGVSASLKPLAIVFLLRDAGRAYESVGLVLAAEVVGAACGSLVQGRLIDRFGPRRVLPAFVLVHVSLLAVFVIGVTGGAGVLPILGLTLGSGFTQPKLLPALRALWGTLFTGEQRENAYATQAVMSEVVYVLGPLVASVAALAASPTAAMVVAGVLSLIGTMIFAATVKRRTTTPGTAGSERGRGVFAAIRSGQLRALVIVAGLGGVTGGAIELVLPVFAERSGDVAHAGLGFALMAIGSICGGAIYGSRRWHGTLASRFAVFLGSMGVALLPLIAAPGFATVCVLLFVAGGAVAPAEACLYALIDGLAEDASVVEANSWADSLYTLGIGVGTAGGGVLVSNVSVPAGSAIPAAATILSALVVLAFVHSRPSADRTPPAEPVTAA